MESGLSHDDFSLIQQNLSHNESEKEYLEYETGNLTFTLPGRYAAAQPNPCFDIYYICTALNALIIVSYTLAMLAYYKTFNQSLRFYLLLKCTTVIVMSILGVIGNQLMAASWMNTYDIYQDKTPRYTEALQIQRSTVYMFRAYLIKINTCRKFLICNLNFVFQWDIYRMVCSGLTYSKSFFFKMMFVALFSVLPATASFRYATTSREKGNDYKVIGQFLLKEEFGIEFAYRMIIFALNMFIIYKVSNVFRESLRLQNHEKKPEDRVRARHTSAKQNRFRNIYIFLITMTILNLLSLTPIIMLYCFHVALIRILENCDWGTLNTLIECLADIQNLTCISSSFATDILQNIFAIVDLFPFLAFVKKTQLCSRNVKVLARPSGQ